MIEYFDSPHLKGLSLKLEKLRSEQDKCCEAEYTARNAANEVREEYHKGYLKARNNYWMSHGGIIGKCFKVRNDLYGYTHYYRVHDVLRNTDEFYSDRWGVVFEFVGWLDSKSRPTYYRFYTSWIDESCCTPNNECSLTEWDEVKRKFFEWKNNIKTNVDF